MGWIGIHVAKIDVAFVVDTTGSMKDDIRAVKDSLFDIVDKIVARTEGLSIRFGVVSYRDHPPQDRTYVTRVFDFSARVRDVHDEISRLRPSEGGDTPEAVADALFDARTKLSWDRDAYKVLLLVGDAPPHGRLYNSLSDDYFPDGCPKGFDPCKEIQNLGSDFGTTVFVYVIGCNPLVEASFKKIAGSIENGMYFSLSQAHQLPEQILKILEGMSDLIEEDRRVLDFYVSNDGSFDIGSAAAQLKMETRQLKICLSRLLELERIPRWPRGRPLTAEKIGISVTLGDVPDALIAGRAFNYRVRVNNPSPTVTSVRIIVTLVTEDGVSEITNEQHEISPRDDRQLELSLVPMTESKEKASVKVEVYYGSKVVASRIYTTRVY